MYRVKYMSRPGIGTFISLCVGSCRIVDSQNLLDGFFFLADEYQKHLKPNIWCMYRATSSCDFYTHTHALRQHTHTI